MGIFDCWTPENHYRWSKSRYGGHVSATVETVNKSQLLLCSMILQTLSYIGVIQMVTTCIKRLLFFSFFPSEALILMCVSFASYFAGSDAGEIENLKSKKMELEENLTSLEESVRSLQTEQRHIEDEAARLRKERVCLKKRNNK